MHIKKYLFILLTKLVMVVTRGYVSVTESGDAVSAKWCYVGFTGRANWGGTGYPLSVEVTGA